MTFERERAWLSKDSDAAVPKVVWEGGLQLIMAF